MGIVWSMVCEDASRGVPPDRDPLVVRSEATDPGIARRVGAPSAGNFWKITHRAVREQIAGMTVSGGALYARWTRPASAGDLHERLVGRGQRTPAPRCSPRA